MKVIFGVVKNIVLNNIKCLPFTTQILSFFVRCKNGSKSIVRPELRFILVLKVALLTIKLKLSPLI